jgi:hypothetical protein
MILEGPGGIWIHIVPDSEELCVESGSISGSRIGDSTFLIMEEEDSAQIIGYVFCVCVCVCIVL